MRGLMDWGGKSSHDWTSSILSTRPGSPLYFSTIADRSRVGGRDYRVSSACVSRPSAGQPSIAARTRRSRRHDHAVLRVAFNLAWSTGPWTGADAPDEPDHRTDGRLDSDKVANARGYAISILGHESRVQVTCRQTDAPAGSIGLTSAVRPSVADSFGKTVRDRRLARARIIDGRIARATPAISSCAGRRDKRDLTDPKGEDQKRGRFGNRLTVEVKLIVKSAIRSDAHAGTEQGIQ